MLWRQGEADDNSTTYVTGWITFYARLLSERWFGQNIPIKLFDISTFGTPALGNIFNKNLTRIAPPLRPSSAIFTQQWDWLRITKLVRTGGRATAHPKFCVSRSLEKDERSEPRNRFRNKRMGV